MIATPLTQSFEVLTAQWYNALIKNCGLNPGAFQLVQGSQPLVSTSERMWDIFDAVPPASINHLFNPSQFNSFSSDYGGVINNLLVPQGQALGNPVSVAVRMWSDMAEAAAPFGGVRAYNGTVSQLQTALESSGGVQFKLDTDNESADVSRTWAGAVISSPPGLEALAAALSATTGPAAGGPGITYNVTFDHILTFPVGPLAAPSDDPTLAPYTPWYHPDALKLAHSVPDNTVWKPGAHPDWSDTFGPGGNMLYACTALVVVDGVNITMQQNAGASGNHSALPPPNGAPPGVMALILPSAGPQSPSNAPPPAGDLITISAIPPGNPVILGAVVKPTGETFS